MSSDDLYKLEFLSLVAKITQELENHLGISDKTLAEFVINLHDKSKSLTDFTERLKEVGADLPDSFVQNLDRLILRMHPRFKKKKKKQTENANDGGEQPAAGNDWTSDRDLEKQRRLFPGLAKPDNDPEQLVSKDILMKEVDDMMSQFEQAVSKSKSRPRMTDDPRDEDERPTKRRRRSFVSPPPPHGSRNGKQEYSKRPQVDDRPALYKIYEGRVASTKDFGAFVKLEGIAGRIEGTSDPLFSREDKYSDLLVQGWSMSPIFNKEPVQIPPPISLAAGNSSRSK
jgi:ATP-dependent RNA helicase DHX8/PRP22